MHINQRFLEEPFSEQRVGGISCREKMAGGSVVFLPICPHIL
ncbi:hypothetical protein HMPREF3213_02067 [Heyndrickxia coagulans]|uniref:Uncharacterized protein n=1 Tax=Heyndrickxia coagulans TaxID=1398 RepID=A0A0C5C9E9_HEYCO|nr:hypothetical protein SB48_HM08orf01891 [Heyndrickxia coagulans]KWZ81131.1 hypothetical protein HMPREF3213_02067 [Heyndrickxia coagulans]